MQKIHALNLENATLILVLSMMAASPLQAFVACALNAFNVYIIWKTWP